MASRIPDDLLEEIGKRLSTKTDVSRLRAVCKSWRSLIPPLEKQQIQFPIRVNWWDKEYELTESVVYHLAPPGDDPSERGWLMKVKEGRCGKTLMLDPLSQRKAYCFLESFPKVLNLLDYRVFEVSRTYEILGDKVVMSLDLDNFPVFMFVNNIGRLYYGKFGFEDEKSIQVRKFTSGCFNEFMLFEDVIFYEGKFYAVSMDGEIVVVDSCLNGTLLKPKLVSSGPQMFSSEKVSRTLVESGGDLLLIVRYLVKKKQQNTKLRADEKLVRYSSKKRKKKHTEFRVYKLSANNKEWRELQKEVLLSDRLLILGGDCSYFVSRLDFPRYTGNNIYFSTLENGCRRYWKSNFDLEAMFRAIGVYGLSNDRCQTLRSCKTFDNIFYPPETHLSSMNTRLETQRNSSETLPKIGSRRPFDKLLLFCIYCLLMAIILASYL